MVKPSLRREAQAAGEQAERGQEEEKRGQGGPFEEHLGQRVVGRKPE